jgi:ribonuclease HI
VRNVSPKPAYGEHDLDEFRARLTELRGWFVPPEAAVKYVAYTDGACFGNPRGPGGWAAAVFSVDGESSWKLFGHLSSTSNNRAEALGVLGALEWVPAGSALELHCDSELTVNILHGRYKVRANTDIWDVIGTVRSEKQLKLTVEWVPGHAGEPGNELADRLSKLGALNREIEHLGDLPKVAPIQRAPEELAGLQARTDWEREFLSSLADQLRRGRPLSPKQQAVVDRMRGRSAVQ